MTSVGALFSSMLVLNLGMAIPRNILLIEESRNYLRNGNFNVLSGLNTNVFYYRAVGRSENPGVPVVIKRA